MEFISRNNETKPQNTMNCSSENRKSMDPVNEKDYETHYSYVARMLDDDHLSDIESDQEDSDRAMSSYLMHVPNFPYASGVARQSHAIAAMQNNQKVLENMDEGQFKKEFTEKMKCMLCDSGIKLYRCEECLNGFCMPCHHRLGGQIYSKMLKCPFCRKAHNEFQVITLPRM